MANKTHDLCVVTGTYQKDGQEKSNFLNVGAVMKDDSGDGTKTFILLDRTFNPAGVINPDNRPNLLINVFEAKKKEPDF